MIGGLGVGELSILVAIILVLVVPILYLLTLRKAVLRCQVENREISPGLIWLLVVPIFNIFWQFFVVIKLSKTIENEFNFRGIEIQPNPTQNVGLAMGIFEILGIVPMIGALLALIGIVLWIIYWVKVANLSSKLISVVPNQIKTT